MRACTTKHIQRVVQVLAALPLLAALLLPVRALAQQPATQALQQAVNQLAQFQGEVDRMRGIVHQSVGPYEVGSSCYVCDTKILGICFSGHNEGWRMGVVLGGMQQVDQVLAQSQNDGVRLEESYAPTRAWIAGLPAFSTRFSSTADVVLALQQQIRQGQAATPEQRDQVTAALGSLQADLAQSAGQLEAGVRTLAIALQKQSDYRNAIRQAIDMSNQSAQQDLARVERDASTRRCQEGVPEQFNAIRARFSSSTQQLAQAFSQLGATSSEAEKSLSVLLGAVVSSRTDMQNVLNLVQAARNDQIGSFLEQLHLAAAKKQWEDLAAAQGRAMLALAANGPAPQ
jgi:uncharacterized phage infection (PIP) family protein YhgE